MSDSFTFDPPRDETQLESLQEILAQTFNVAQENRAALYERLRNENLRCVRAGGDIVGGLGLVPMGQFFGGKSVPMTGIALVGVAPAWRGSGAGGALMKQAVRELNQRGVALSTLYPATQPIYRSAGYEQAGSQFRITLNLKQMTVKDRSLVVRDMTDDDASIVESMYRRYASMHNGTLDRGSYIWIRTRNPIMQRASGYVVERDGVPEGYLLYLNNKTSFWEFELLISDVIALTPDAGRRLLALLANHRSLSDHARLVRPPNDPILIQLSEQCYEVQRDISWMLRIAHVENALAARGYPGLATGEVHFEIEDDVIDSNADRYVLHVERGAARVERGGEGRVKLDVRSLAMLYSAYLTPQQLRAAGRMDAGDEDVERLTALFASPAPWMGDMF